MKNSLIIIESNLTYEILLYEQKSYPFIKLFFFKIMVIEILWNNDIQLLFCSNILKFKKEINIITYIIENFKK